MPDRVGLEASQTAWAAAQQAPDNPAECAMTHDGEIRAAHQGQPSVQEQDRRNGAGIPAVDRGPQ